MKRNFLVEKTKDAQRIGVLVGTLGVSRYRDIIDHVTRAIRSSGRKAYLFLVGKPNVPKLANFPEIEVFVLVACPENSLVDAKEFMQPVVTPYELDLALNKDREWSSNFIANFQDLLPGQPSHVEFQVKQEDGADVSLVTGKVRALGVSESGNSSALVAQDRTIAEIHQGGGGEYLQERSWKGLEQKVGQTQVKKAGKGLKGIAMGYETEPSQPTT